MQAMLEGRYYEDPDDPGLHLPAFAGHGGAWEEFWIPVPDPSGEYRRPAPDGACALR